MDLVRLCCECAFEPKAVEAFPCNGCIVDMSKPFWSPVLPESAEPQVNPVPKETFTSNDMTAFFKELQEAEYKLWKGKNDDYADHEGKGQGNTFANFDSIAEELDMAPEQVAWVYLRKQLQALLRYVKHGKLETEPLMNRIIDARNFLAIIGGIARRKGDL